MDVFLTADADRFIRAMSLLAGAPVRGYLIGHRRGPRYFVESLIPAAATRSLSYRDIQCLDRLFGGKSIGFFVLGKGGAAEALKSGPFACGRVVLEAKSGAGRGPRLRAFVVDYDGRFILTPVPVATGRDGGKP